MIGLQRCVGLLVMRRPSYSPEVHRNLVEQVVGKRNPAGCECGLYHPPAKGSNYLRKGRCDTRAER